MVKKVKSKYWQHTHKYDICIPNSVKEAYGIDEETWNTLCCDAISLEMPKIICSLQEHEGTVKELGDNDY